jgi:hypothetical protein
MQINIHNIAYEGQESHNHPYRSRKACDRTQHPFMIKIPEEMRNRRIISQNNKGYRNDPSQHCTEWRTTKAFPLKS